MSLFPRTPTLLFNVHQGFFLEIELVGVKLTTYLHLVEIKDEWSCTSPPPITFQGVEKDNFALHKRITGRENGIFLPEAGKQSITQPQISKGGLTHAMPFPCHATNMPF
jgi:hypothetical protein